MVMKTDQQIRRNIIEELKLDPQLSKIAPRIGVSVKDEVVTLTGMVDFYSQKLAAENAAHRVKEVKVVATDIEVRSMAHSERTDDSKIADAVRNALVWHSGVNEDLVNIKVEDGWVYLDGMVDWDYERRAAEKSIEHLPGVKGVIDRITLKQQVIDPSEIKNKIIAAFHRHATVDSASINVETSANKVILTGSVRTWTERTDAEDVAWLAPGVTEVENKLEIEHETYVDE
jgi:osmotically-inducible protein OsmY